MVLLADDLISLSPEGVGGKAQVMDITAAPDKVDANVTVSVRAFSSSRPLRVIQGLRFPPQLD